MKHLLSLALVFACTCTAFAQKSAPVISPEIQADHSVTFRLLAPKSQSVAMRGQWEKEAAALTKDAEGLWSLTVPAVPAGVWEYSFIVDGLTMIDPANPALKPQRNPTTQLPEC